MMEPDVDDRLRPWRQLGERQEERQVDAIDRGVPLDLPTSGGHGRAIGSGLSQGA